MEKSGETSRPGRFTSEKSPGTNSMTDWLGPKAGLDVFNNIEVLPLPEYKLRIVQPVA